MKRTALYFVIPIVAFLAGACASGGPAAREDFFPRRIADARAGILTNEGTTSLNVWIYDEANRLIEEIYLPPARDPLSSLAVNQQRSPVVVVKALPPGNYRVVYIPFYYEFRVLGPNYRVDLPRGSSGIYVGRDPQMYYDHYTRRNWGWALRLNGGDMPREGTLRNIGINININ